MRPRHLLYIPAVLLVLAAGAFAFLYFRTPTTVPPLDIRVDMSPARIERGRYLYNLADCDGCHSQRDFTRFGGPVVETGKGRGQVMPLAGLPGRIVAANLTPDPETGLGKWTDGEKIRAIREGVDRDGRTLFPMMPYPSLAKMSDNDVQSLVAYLNTLKPVRNPLPATEVSFPVSMFIKGVPSPAGKVPDPNRQRTESYGKYLATIGGCAECHTPMQRGRLDSSLLFAGGRRFDFANFSVVSANITPDPETGLGKWDYARFSQRFRNYKEYVDHGSPQVGPDRFTLMPWLNLSQLPEEDLQALWAYLHTLTPIEHKVEKLKL